MAEIITRERRAHSPLGTGYFLRNLLRGFAARKRIKPIMKGKIRLKIYGTAKNSSDNGPKNIIKSMQRERSVLYEINFKKSPPQKNRKSNYTLSILRLKIFF